MSKYRFSLQYPKPLTDEEFESLRPLFTAGGFSRYASGAAEELEGMFAKFFGVKHAVACSSGTAAIHAALIACDLPVGSEVITTPITDVGVVLPIIYQNLVPVFADVDPTTFNLDAKSVESRITKNTSAIIAVHLAGNPAPIREVKALADKHNLILIEDCSQAHGAEYDGKRVGSMGKLGIASLQQSKHITSGEGGVIVTDDSALFERLKLSVDKGWTRFKSLRERRYEFLSLNYRYTGIQAAVVIPQMKRVAGILKKKRELAAYLYKRAEEFGGLVGCQRTLAGTQHSYYSFPMYVNGDEAMRDALMEMLAKDSGVECAYGYANPVPLYLCTAALENPKKFGRSFKYSDRSYPKGTCPAAEDLLNRSFLLPFNEKFEISDMEYMMDAFAKAVAKLTPVGAGR